MIVRVIFMVMRAFFIFSVRGVVRNRKCHNYSIHIILYYILLPMNYTILNMKKEISYIRITRN